jgi:hypothetical protein
MQNVLSERLLRVYARVSRGRFDMATDEGQAMAVDALIQEARELRSIIQGRIDSRCPHCKGTGSRLIG